VFEGMETERVNALLVADASENIAYRQLIAELAARHRLPAIYPDRESVEAGGLMSYGVDPGDVMRRLADITVEVLKGPKPGDIPFYQQTPFELVLNRAAANELGLEFPTSLLATADEMIE
jgi:putative tryptophan/tyrosine transport system substrate-binding protein